MHLTFATGRARIILTRLLIKMEEHSEYSRESNLADVSRFLKKVDLKKKGYKNGKSVNRNIDDCRFI